MGNIGEEIDVVVVEPLGEPAPTPAPPQPEPVRAPAKEPVGSQELAPDYSEPIIGWRCWGIKLDRDTGRPY